MTDIVSGKYVSQKEQVLRNLRKAMNGLPELDEDYIRKASEYLIRLDTISHMNPLLISIAYIIVTSVDFPNFSMSALNMYVDKYRVYLLDSNASAQDLTGKVKENLFRYCLKLYTN